MFVFIFFWSTSIVKLFFFDFVQKKESSLRLRRLFSFLPHWDASWLGTSTLQVLFCLYRCIFFLNILNNFRCHFRHYHSLSNLNKQRENNEKKNESKMCFVHLKKKANVKIELRRLCVAQAPFFSTFSPFIHFRLVLAF